MSIQAPLTIVTLVPTYNHERFIETCVRGIMNQELLPGWLHRIVISDDGSSDGTQEILKGIESRNPQVELVKMFTQADERVNRYRYNGRITGKENMRQLMRVNKTFEDAHYIAFCEGDDFWSSPTKLKEQIVFLEEQRDYSICWTQAIVINEEGQELERTAIKQELEFDDVRFNYPVGHTCCSAVWRAQAFNWELYDRSFLLYSNNDAIWLNALLFGKGRVLNGHWVSRRVHAGGIWSGEDRILRKINEFDNVNDLGNLFGEAGFPSEELRSVLEEKVSEVKEMVTETLSLEDSFRVFWHKYRQTPSSGKKEFWKSRWYGRIEVLRGKSNLKSNLKS